MVSLWASPSFYFLSGDPALSFPLRMTFLILQCQFLLFPARRSTLSRILGFVAVIACCFAGLFLREHCWRALCHCPGCVLTWLIIHSQFRILFTRQQMALLLVLILYVISLHSLSYQAVRNGLDKSVISQERYL